ncbi:DUF4347 domain-containing protein, partial [Tychonema sp. LEGE 07203]|uniref:DUF4347 domain-containing protein n=1 Tax=Tychonema sp. LEGE 07203 TaxID=1828671 RepID=UPI001883058A
MAAKNNFFFAGASSQAQPEAKKSLVVVDSKVENYEQLIGGVKAGTEVFILSETGGAIDQITEILRQRQNINSLHVVSHGREAAIAIGPAELNLDNLETHSNQLQQWRKSLSQSASILLYGCNIASGKSGLKFIQKINELTGANIAASQNLTGSAALGGDWELEITTGQINSELAFETEVLENYTSVLATLVSENFKNATVIGPWKYGVGGASANPGLTAGTFNPNGVIPNIGIGDAADSGALRLTSNAQNQAAFVLYDNPISATGGLRVTFDFFAYNRGNVTDPLGQLLGADGLSFFLIDGTATPTAAGGFGGSLGYAQNNNLLPASTGIVGGYLGVGLDEFGNFSNNGAGRVGGSAAGLQDSIGIRGSQSTSYAFITNAAVPIGIDNALATNRTDPNTKRSVQITLLPPTSTIAPNRLTVALDLNENGTFDAGETLITILDLSTFNGIVPSTFKFGFAASTGPNTNIHEINNVLVESIDEPTLQADVSIVKKGPLYAIPSSTITYTITSTNNGPNSAESVLIQDPLPADLTFVSASDGATYNPVTRNVIWPVIPTLANGTSVIRTITAIVPATPGTVLTNTAYSDSSTFDPVPANNNSSQPTSQVPTTIINNLADVVTTKSGTLNSAAGGTVSYEIVTQNNGPSTADNVTITDSIVPGLTGISISDGGTYDSISGVVTFPLVTLTNTQSITRRISFIAPASGSVSNTARSNSSTPDPTPGNNDGTAPGASVITILTPNQPPVATPTNLTLGANSSVPVAGLGGNDPDGSIASYTINTLPPAAQGILFLGDPANGGVAVTPGQPLTPEQIGQLFFQSTGDFTGATFSYTATDNLGSVSSPANANLGLTGAPPNQAPEATPTSLTVGPNSSAPVTGLGGNDPDGSIASYTINTLPPAAQGILFLGDPANGGVAVTPGQPLTPEQIGQLFFQSTGDFTGATFSY